MNNIEHKRGLLQAHAVKMEHQYGICPPDHNCAGTNERGTNVINVTPYGYHDFDSMPPGPEMDALVEERVMCDRRDHVPLQPYSTDEAEALKVAKHIRICGERGIQINYTADSDCDDAPWLVTIYGLVPGEESIEVWGESLALAICRAALKATTSR